MAQRLRSQKVKIALLGANGVGKTAFAVRFLTKRFIGDYLSNTEEYHSHKLVLDREDVNLELVDTAGKPTGLDRTAKEHMSSADGVVLMMSLDNRGSLQTITQLSEILHEVNRRRHSMAKLHHSATSSSSAASGSTSAGVGEEPLVAAQAIVVINKTDIPHACQISDSEISKLKRRIGYSVFELSVSESPEAVTSSMLELMRLIRKEQNRAKSPVEKKPGTFLTVKKVLRKKIARSKSDSTGYLHS